MSIRVSQRVHRCAHDNNPEPHPGHRPDLTSTSYSAWPGETLGPPGALRQRGARTFTSSRTLTRARIVQDVARGPQWVLVRKPTLHRPSSNEPSRRENIVTLVAATRRFATICIVVLVVLASMPMALAYDQLRADGSASVVDTDRLRPAPDEPRTGPTAPPEPEKAPLVASVESAASGSAHPDVPATPNIEIARVADEFAGDPKHGKVTVPSETDRSAVEQRGFASVVAVPTPLGQPDRAFSHSISIQDGGGESLDVIIDRLIDIKEHVDTADDLAEKVGDLVRALDPETPDEEKKKLFDKYSWAAAKEILKAAKVSPRLVAALEVGWDIGAPFGKYLANGIQVAADHSSYTRAVIGYRDGGEPQDTIYRHGGEAFVYETSTRTFFVQRTMPHPESFWTGTWLEFLAPRVPYWHPLKAQQ